jgi:hypothetical protein
VSDAFDLSKEDPRLIARYDTAPLLPRDRIDPQWKNIKHYGEKTLASMGVCDNDLLIRTELALYRVGKR